MAIIFDQFINLLEFAYYKVWCQNEYKKIVYEIRINKHLTKREKVKAIRLIDKGYKNQIPITPDEMEELENYLHTLK